VKPRSRPGARVDPSKPEPNGHRPVMVPCLDAVNPRSFTTHRITNPREECGRSSLNPTTSLARLGATSRSRSPTPRTRRPRALFLKSSRPAGRITTTRGTINPPGRQSSKLTSPCIGPLPGPTDRPAPLPCSASSCLRAGRHECSDRSAAAASFVEEHDPWVRERSDMSPDARLTRQEIELPANERSCSLALSAPPLRLVVTAAVPPRHRDDYENQRYQSE
jgi:hypothetical protein